jgi:DNA-binding NarL/FixJ family response regulator
LIVDDHAFVRQGIRSLLEGYADIHVVGAASDGLEAIMMMDRLRPRVILMDINIPRMNGIEATAHIKGWYPDAIIIGLSLNASRESQEMMSRAGAVRLIPKVQASELLHDAIQEAVRN